MNMIAKIRMTRTRYPKSVVHRIDEYPHKLFKTPNKKLGGEKVTRGQFKGYRIRTLTLQERTTCPDTCTQWDNCYGNNMPFAHRFEPGPGFLARIRQEVGELAEKYPDGVLFRLHILGDFYSNKYVRLWGELLRQYPNIAVWGYTHVNHSASHDNPRLYMTFSALVRMRSVFGARWSVRWSDQLGTPYASHVVPSFDHADNPDGFPCPEQLPGSKATCSSCGLCWENQDRPVLFREH